MHRQLRGLPGAGNNGFPSHPYFPVFCLVRSGVHVPPFTDHLAFDHPIQAKGFTSENWKRWVEALTVARYVREYYTIFDRTDHKPTHANRLLARYYYGKVEDCFGKQPSFGQRLDVPPEFTKDGPSFINHWKFGESDVITQWLIATLTEFNDLEDRQGDVVEKKSLEQMLQESNAFVKLDQKARNQDRFILSSDIIYSKPCFYFVNPEYLLIACRNEQEKITQLTLALNPPQ